MAAINMHDAKTNFSRLIGRVEAGEEVIIARAGKPVANVVQNEPQPKPSKRVGCWLFCYTVNSAARARTILNWGCDAFCTDAIDQIAGDFAN
jgi:prevent-host-death family protein